MLGKSGHTFHQPGALLPLSEDMTHCTHSVNGKFDDQVKTFELHISLCSLLLMLEEFSI